MWIPYNKTSYYFILAKRLTEKENEKLVRGFKSGKTIKALSEEFSFTNATIIRKLKKNLGVSAYKELNKKNKNLIKKIILRVTKIFIAIIKILIQKILKRIF